MSRSRRRFIVLFLLCLVALVVMTYQYTKKPLTLFKVLSYPYDVLNNVTSSVTGTIKDIVNTFEENKRLRKELSAALLERQQYGELFQENKRLKELLSLREQSHNYVAAAKVIGRGYDRFLNTLILDKGESSGIKKDMAVITTKGLVGKIYSVRGDFSEVLLLKDPNFSVSVRLQDSRHEGVLTGTGYDYCLLKYIPFQEKVEKGEVVVTSGLDGMFPSGLPVGVVTTIGDRSKGFFLEIQVVPFQPEAEIEEVVVIRSEVSPPLPRKGKS